MEAGVVSLGGEAALLSMPGNPGSARQKASRRPPVNMNESLAACSSARAKSPNRLLCVQSLIILSGEA